MSTKDKKHSPLGSSFDAFLQEEGLHEEATLAAAKRVLALQLAREMEHQHLTKTQMARRMHTSRSSLEEHCGMQHVPAYRRRWEEKLAWYKANGILPHGEGGGPRGTLIITRDEANGSIDSAKITRLLDEIVGG